MVAKTGDWQGVTGVRGMVPAGKKPKKGNLNFFSMLPRSELHAKHISGFAVSSSF
jgi:hypothetical protein